MSVTKRIPILVGMDVLLIFYFLIAAVTRYSTAPDSSRGFFTAVLLTNTLFIVSLFMIRVRRYTAASVIGSCAILVQVSWIAFLLPTTSAQDIYRLMVYLIASSIANAMIALDRRQLPLYFVAGLVVFFAAVLAVFVPAAGGFTAELRTVAATLLLLNIAANIALVFTGRLNRQLQELAETESGENRKKAAELAALIEGTKGSLEIGKTLLDASRESNARGVEIHRSLSKLDTAAAELSEETRVAEESNRSILEHAKTMHTKVAELNGVIDKTTGSIAEIAGTIKGIADLAQDRKASMNQVLSDVERQGGEIARIIDGFANIRQTSAEVLGSVKGILDVSEKTDMLAMNASIEAAHAGASGKGFAVISAEIRKLSEETRLGTRAISDSIARNESAVEAAAGAVRTFAEEIEAVVVDVRATFDAIEEIINGLGDISAETGELDTAARRMAAIAKDADASSKGVAERLGKSAASVAEISEFSKRLKNLVENILSDFSVIEKALAKVKSIGERNITEIGSFGEKLDSINSRR